MAGGGGIVVDVRDALKGGHAYSGSDMGDTFTDWNSDFTVNRGVTNEQIAILGLFLLAGLWLWRK